MWMKLHILSAFKRRPHSSLFVAYAVDSRSKIVRVGTYEETMTEKMSVYRYVIVTTFEVLTNKGGIPFVKLLRDSKVTTLHIILFLVSHSAYMHIVIANEICEVKSRLPAKYQ
jgi:hypothetical protein